MRRLSGARIPSLLPVPVWLAVLFLAQFFAIRKCFYPGIIAWSPDTLQQYRQAIGQIPYNDWHPPILAWVWELLYKWTGATGSMYSLEIFLATFGCFLLAWAVHRDQRVRSRFLPFIVSLLPTTPFLFCLLGWIWKDLFMTWLALDGIALIYLCTTFRARWLKVASYIIAICLWAVATCFRVNGLLYLVFLLPLPILGTYKLLKPRLAQSSSWRSFFAKSVIALAVFALYGGMTFGCNTAINAVTKPVKTHQIDQMFLDDLVNLNDTEGIDSLPGTSDFKNFLLSIKTTCDGQVLQNVIWNCAGAKQPAEGELDDGTWVQPVLAKYHDQYLPAWKQSIRKNYKTYLKYRVDMYSRFLFETRVSAPALPLTSTQLEQLGTDNPFLLRAAIRYANTTKTCLPSLFSQGAFWLIASAAIWIANRYWRRLGPRGDHLYLFINWLSVASVLSILSLLPLVPAPEYRYCYFAVLTTTLSGLLLYGRWRNAWTGSVAPRKKSLVV